MKHLSIYTILTFLLICSLGCGTTTGVVKKKSNHNLNRNLVQDREDPNLSTLLDILRSEPGLQISGQNVIIRGVQFISGDNRPLYVLDGTPLGRSYADAAATVDLNTIASIRVLKGPHAGRYGNRGANGVIEIKTKTF